MQQKDKEILQNFGKHLKDIRSSKSKSLNKFVFEKGGITTATLSRIENGLVDFKFTTLVKMASALNMTLSELLNEFDCKYEITD